MSRDNPVCKGCGFETIPVFDDDEPPPEYCCCCDPIYPRVKPSDLERLVSVPSAYRKLVELNLASSAIRADWFWRRVVLDRRSHRGVWRARDTLIDSSGRVVVYAPNFQSFLYRAALEDASGRWQILPDELPPKIRP